MTVTIQIPESFIIKFESWCIDNLVFCTEEHFKKAYELFVKYSTGEYLGDYPLSESMDIFFKNCEEDLEDEFKI